MKTLNTYINEALIGKNTKVQHYSYFPKDKYELQYILEERLSKDKNANLNNINVSEITDMSDLFSGLDPHNIDISDWDVSKVKNMYCMFHCCENLNCNLSNWKVSNVRDMEGMFAGCKKFNCNLSLWDIREVRSMRAMFDGCIKFKGEGLENWVPIKCTNMYCMLRDCSLKKYPSWYNKLWQ